MKKLQTVDSYYLSFNSYLIEPIEHGDKLYSRVYDKSGEVIVSRKPLYIIRKSCDLMGSKYNAAREFSKRFLGDSKHKLPVIIAYDYGVPLVFFPILSPTSSSNVWVGLHSIINIQSVNDQTKITLKDEREIILQLPQTSFNNQYVRATMLQKHASNKRLIIQNDLLL
ncbi:competence protein ComK [Ureibacillus acetophenoni]|uniref:Competence protein ComK n=1 Tax=Ureibacillus acetophenoni TaxID=614649 RepID=A0A285TZ63_9BACL|nr:competence protein ComK [Ureibacillus acetophenoni]SOC35010.1 competence protein ComK [Ureibacillus acetophenoni]